jgi:CHAT domain
MSTILIATANDKNDSLHKLEAEGKEIQRILNSSLRKNYDIVLLPHATTDDIIDELNVPNRSVEIIHFAGHSDSEHVLFSDTDAKAGALALKLKETQSVRLVFINGCQSQNQVQYFHESGIPFVIATARPINDYEAYWLATQFYNYLALGRMLRSAFDAVYNDADFQNKHLPFGGERGIVRKKDIQDNTKTWGLYILNDDNSLDYSLPFRARLVANTEGVNHEVFLDNLIFALEELESPSIKEIKQIAKNLKRGDVPFNTKRNALLNALPFTLGIRIGKLFFNPEEKASEYYEALLFNYGFLFETLLHHAAAILMAQIWQHKNTALNTPPKDLQSIKEFWQINRLQESPHHYAHLIVQLIEWSEQADIPIPIKDNDIVELKNYLNSSDFRGTCAFFFQQNKYIHQKIRLTVPEFTENCAIAQDKLIQTFQYLKWLAAYEMASIMGVNVTNFRHVKREFGNVVSRLMGTHVSPTPLYSETKMLENKSILLYKTESGTADDLLEVENPTTLFPFIIDRNAFTNKSKDIVDLYLFIGYFKADNDKTLYHYVSIEDPKKVWRFDENEKHTSLLHIGETAKDADEENHLKVNMAEFKLYLTEFKNIFLTS